MPCPRARTGSEKFNKHINSRLHRPWTAEARTSKRLRRWLDKHGYATPNFSWSELHSNNGEKIPAALRRKAIGHAWNLERFRHALGNVSMSVDGPYRSVAYNRQIGGAEGSYHTKAVASDFFSDQIDRWIAQSPKLENRQDVLDAAYRIWAKGGVGNETSGTLHVDSRGYKARFVTWTSAS